MSNLRKGLAYERAKFCGLKTNMSELAKASTKLDSFEHGSVHWCLADTVRSVPSPRQALGKSGLVHFMHLI